MQQGLEEARRSGGQREERPRALRTFLVAEEVVVVDVLEALNGALTDLRGRGEGGRQASQARAR